MTLRTWRAPVALALAAALASGPLGVAAGSPEPTLPKAELAALRARLPQRAASAQAHLIGARSQLGLDSRAGFHARSSFTNGQGQAIVHLDQTFDGHRVWGGQAIAHVLPDGTIRTLTQGLLPGVAVEGQPALSPERAVAIAVARLDPKGPMRDAPRVERVVFPARFTGGLAWTTDPASGRPVLDRRNVVHARPAAPFVWAYEVKTRLQNREDGLREMVYVVDGNTGAVLRVHDAIQRLAPGVTPATGSGIGYYRGAVTVPASRLADGTYALYDPTRGTLPNPNLEQISGFTGSDPSGWSPTGLQVWYDEHTADAVTTWNTFLFQLNPVNAWGDGLPFSAWGQENGPNGQTAGVDAMSAMADVWDFYRNVFGREGMDGLGTSAFATVLMTDPGYRDNAWWSFWANGAYLGAGSYPADPRGLLSLTDLDVVAHEMTHGVSGSTANFVNAAGYEEGGLAEATSDFFAQMVKAWAGRDPGAPADVIPATGADWQIGAGVAHGTPLRRMDRPSWDQRSVDGWYDGMKFLDGHFSAGPVNRALFFLAQGASANPADPSFSAFLPEGMTGIGNDAAARIWFKTVTERLHGDGSGTITFLDARREAVLAAQELFPGDPAKAIAVENAFGAVNVGDAHGKAPHLEVLFADCRNGDYVEKGHEQYANREIFPKHETVSPRITVRNATSTAVTWSLGGPSVFNGADSWVTKGGVLNADGSWTTPNRMGWHAITATSQADARQMAEGRVFLIDMDNDMDGEQDALDMGAIAFSWFLTNSLNPAHSVFEAPWVDDGDVSFFVDAMASTWPTK
jgi:Zn-dependent metalloprotease